MGIGAARAVSWQELRLDRVALDRHRRSSCRCNLLHGDLVGTVTISGPTEAGWGSLNEQSMDGSRTLTLSTVETRTFLEDGDEAIFRAHCHRDGYAPIGFGECRARII